MNNTIEIFLIVLQYPMFYVNLIFSLFIVSFLYFKSKKYILQESLAQFGITFVVMFIAYNLAFRNDTELIDFEYRNGWIVSAVFEEPYEREYDCSTENCVGSGTNRICTKIPQTCYENISAKYYLKTSNDEKINIDINTYFNYVNYSV